MWRYRQGKHDIKIMNQLFKKSTLILLCADLIFLFIAGCTSTSLARPKPSAPAAPEITVTPTHAIPHKTPDEPLPTIPLPNQTPTTAGCVQQNGRIEALELNNPDLIRPLSYQVYLPPCYSSTLSGGYPVILLLHGQSMTDAVWQELGIQEIADQLIRNQEMPPFVIVMPREEYFLQAFKESEFDNALIEVLLPEIAERYNTSPERTCRAIGGISRGASWAMELGWTHWKEFGAIGAHSIPNASFSGSRLRTLKESISPNDLPRILIDIGESDRYFKGAQQLHTLFDQMNIPHQWQVGTGAHNAAYWQTHLESYLRWYAAGWEESCTKAIP